MAVRLFIYMFYLFSYNKLNPFYQYSPFFMVIILITFSLGYLSFMNLGVLLDRSYHQFKWLPASCFTVTFHHQKFKCSVSSAYVIPVRLLLPLLKKVIFS